MIGIIGAMESEVKAIYEKMTSKQEIKLKHFTKAVQFTFISSIFIKYSILN